MTGRSLRLIDNWRLYKAMSRRISVCSLENMLSEKTVQVPKSFRPNQVLVRYIVLIFACRSEQGRFSFGSKYRAKLRMSDCILTRSGREVNQGSPSELATILVS